jgi:hypothetical protein
MNIVNQLTHETWISIVVSGALGYAALSLSLVNRSYKRVLLDIASTGGIIFLVVYKAFPILLAPGYRSGSGFITLFLSNGISEGLYAGALCSLLYVFVKLKHQSIPTGVLVEKLPLGIMASFMAFHLLNWNVGKETVLLWGVTLQDPTLRYHPVSMYQLIVCFLFLIRYLTQNNKAGVHGFAGFCFWFCSTQVFLSYFLIPRPYVWGLSMFQLFYLLAALVCSYYWLRSSREK